MYFLLNERKNSKIFLYTFWLFATLLRMFILNFMRIAGQIRSYGAYFRYFTFWAITRPNDLRSMIFFQSWYSHNESTKVLWYLCEYREKIFFSILGLFGPIWGPYKNSPRVTTPHPPGNQCIYAIQQFYAKQFLVHDFARLSQNQGIFHQTNSA